MKIDLLFVLLGLIIGLVIVYFTAGPPQAIMKYPNVGNSSKYVDENGVCYRYQAEQVNCD